MCETHSLKLYRRKSAEKTAELARLSRGLAAAAAGAFVMLMALVGTGKADYGPGPFIVFVVAAVGWWHWRERVLIGELGAIARGMTSAERAGLFGRCDCPDAYRRSGVE